MEACGQLVSASNQRLRSVNYGVFVFLFVNVRLSPSLVWLLGNLARATYVGSSDFMWPYSFNTCDAKGRLSQEINACDKINHYGMAPEFGRGSPEIDIIEAMQGNMDEKLPSTHIKRPYQSTSLQVKLPVFPSVWQGCKGVVNLIVLYSRDIFRLHPDWKLTVPFWESALAR